MMLAGRWPPTPRLLKGMRRAILAGVDTIEHGNDGSPEVFKLMKERGVAFCPMVAAGDAILQYRGWKKGSETEPRPFAPSASA